MARPRTSTGERSVLERHVQSVALAAVLGFLGWITNTQLEMKDRTSRMEVLLNAANAQISGLGLDRYTGTDHRRYETEMDRRLNELTRRIDENAKRIDEMAKRGHH